MKQNQSGFTLIEIAIVLVIIGLLLGGVLKGQELINSAKVKNLATDFRNIPLFIYGYQDKFRALPGDDKAADQHMTGADLTTASGVGNGVIEGKWDAKDKAETNLFWQHVRLAGFAAGPTAVSGAGVDLRPGNSAGGSIGITNGNESPITGIVATYVICSSAILGKFAKQLDATMDDGAPDAGSMRAATSTRITNAAGAGISPDNAFVDTESYVVCMGL